MSKQSTQTETVTREALVSRLEQTLGLPRERCRALVNDIIDEFCNVLLEDRKTVISGFGTFSVRSKGARIGQDIRAGKSVIIPPRNAIVFRSSQVLRNRLRASL